MAEAYLVAVVLLGLCVGSFLNVVIYRVPDGSFLSKGNRSRCRSCGEPIPGRFNIPVLGWLWLRGKAACCGVRISSRYPLVEALTAALFGVLWLDVVGGDGPLSTMLLTFVFKAWFVAVLVACTFIDIDHRILPDVLTKPTMVVGCLGAVVVPGLAGLFGATLDDHVESLLYSLLGLLTGYFLTLLVRIVSRAVFKQEAMGFGDVKFMGAIGAFVGWDGAIITFFLGCVFGAIYGSIHAWVTGEGKVFFGPFLALGAGITLFYKVRILTFVTETWPAWQSQLELPPWVLGLVAAVCVFLLIIIVKRGRART